MPAPIQAGTKTTMTDRITMENHRRNHEGGWQLFQDPALRDSWGDCKKRAMVPDISAPYLCGEQEFFSIKENTKKLYAYSNRLINSIYHSLAYCYGEAYREMEAVTGQHWDKLYIAGGGAKNATLNELTAHYTGKQVVALPIEATAIGNLKIQMNIQ